MQSSTTISHLAKCYVTNHPVVQYVESIMETEKKLWFSFNPFWVNFPFYITWEQQKTNSYLVLSGGINRN